MQETKYTIQDYYHVPLFWPSAFHHPWIFIANLQMLHVKIV